tara:strand:- start:261 stop:725 length:465 start_codon:yes stop_codon:yes gene_type:complete
MNHPETMQAKDLLTVTPEALVASILKRRAAAASSLPTTLEQRTEENNRAYQLANDARTSLKQLEAVENPDEGHHSVLEKARNVYDEHETFRRRTDSRLKKVKHAIKDSEEAIQFWSEMGEGGWGHLLEDAERLNEGGESSYAKLKQRRNEEDGQ